MSYSIKKNIILACMTAATLTTAAASAEANGRPGRSSTAQQAGKNRKPLAAPRTQARPGSYAIGKVIEKSSKLGARPGDRKNARRE